MDLQEFTSTIGDLFAYFQTKQPQQRFVALWWEEVKFIPGGEPLRWIRSHLQGMDRLPRNIAKAFKSAWLEYKTAHPEAVVRRNQPTKCPSCGGIGFLFFRDAAGIRRVAFCADCENGFDKVSHGVTARMGIGQLAAMGYHIEPTGV